MIRWLVMAWLRHRHATLVAEREEDIQRQIDLGLDIAEKGAKAERTLATLARWKGSDLKALAP